MNRRFLSAGWLVPSLLVISSCSGDSDSGSSASAGPTVCCSGTEIAFSSDRNGGSCDGNSATGQPPLGTHCQTQFDCGPGGACELNSEIYVTQANGSDPQRITDSPLADFQPTWSPDYTQLAFTSERAGKICDGRGIGGPPLGTPCTTDLNCGLRGRCDPNEDLYVVPSDGSVAATRLTNSLYSDLDPAWSPVAPELVFTSDRSGNFELYICTLPPSAAQITTDFCEQPQNVRQLTTDTGPNPLNDFKPGWSPDGSRIVFWKQPRDFTGSITPGDIYEMEVANPTNQTKLSSASPINSDFSPSWSPDGTKIAYYSSDPGTGNIDIYVCTLPTCDDRKKVTDSSANNSNPTWSPDSSQIAFGSTSAQGQQIAIIDANGSSLTYVSGSGDFPAWQPPPSP